jgi:hypothetical protein
MVRTALRDIRLSFHFALKTAVLVGTGHARESLFAGMARSCISAITSPSTAKWNQAVAQPDLQGRRIAVIGVDTKNKCQIRLPSLPMRVLHRCQTCSIFTRNHPVVRCRRRSCHSGGKRSREKLRPLRIARRSISAADSSQPRCSKKSRKARVVTLRQLSGSRKLARAIL